MFGFGLDRSPPSFARERSLMKRLFELINQVRLANGKQKLEWSDALAAIAEAHAWDTRTRGYQGHVTPEGDGPAARLRKAGIPFTACAENWGVGYESADEAHNHLMNSPGHRDNILSERYTNLGVGIAPYRDRHGRDRFCVVQLFVAGLQERADRFSRFRPDREPASDPSQEQYVEAFKRRLDEMGSVYDGLLDLWVDYQKEHLRREALHQWQSPFPLDPQRPPVRMGHRPRLRSFLGRVLAAARKTRTADPAEPWVIDVRPTPIDDEREGMDE